MNNISPQRFDILPTAIKNLLIINGLLYLAKVTFGAYSSEFIYTYLELHTFHSDYFKVYQLITYLFIHADFTHLFFNMFALWMFGAILENVWGTKKFIRFYLICGIGGGLLHLLFMAYSQSQFLAAVTQELKTYSQENQTLAWEEINRVINIPTVGASGAIFGCLAAFGYLFPNTYLHVYFFIPVKAKWFVTIYILIEVIYLWRSQYSGSMLDSIARVAHLGGALIGLLFVIIENRLNRKQFW